MFVPMPYLRGLPTGYDKLIFINRKNYPALNCLIFAGYDHTIYDIVPNASGSFHDANVYNLSAMKHYLESRHPRVRVLGDSAFALNDTIITPYPKNETLGPANANNRKFNAR